MDTCTSEVPNFLFHRQRVIRNSNGANPIEDQQCGQIFMWATYRNGHVQCGLLSGQVITERLGQGCCFFDSEIKADKCHTQVGAEGNGLAIRFIPGVRNRCYLHFTRAVYFHRAGSCTRVGVGVGQVEGFSKLMREWVNILQFLCFASDLLPYLRFAATNIWPLLANQRPLFMNIRLCSSKCSTNSNCKFQ